MRYRCFECGQIKDILVNHDQLPKLFDRCTDGCMWNTFHRKGPVGPVLYSSTGEKTGFYKVLFVKVD